MRAWLVAMAMTLATLSGAVPEGDEPPMPEGPDPASVEEGKLLFGIYCAGCHGPAAKGDGSAAKSLKPPPADLTRLSRGNDGEFPTARVLMNIDGRNRVPGHTKSQMPIWGLSLQEPSSDTNQEAQVRKKLLHLVDYLKTLQEPPD